MSLETSPTAGQSTDFFEHLHRVIAPGVPYSGSADPSQTPGVFRPLLLGYSGAGNIGADVRVKEMIRQFQNIFAHIRFDPGLVVIGPSLNEPFFRGIRKVPMETQFPQFLAKVGKEHDSVIACEGSMFTSTFSDILSAIFAGGIAYATRRGRLGVGYGAEAGRMTPQLQSFVQESCKDGVIYCRSEQTRQQLDSLGLNTAAGADSAWTFEPEPFDHQKLLRDHGWDGEKPILTVCPINPFWWPVVTDFEKLRALQTTGAHKELHYQGAYFHSWSNELAQKYRIYIDALATQIHIARQQGYFPIVVGMERLDALSCRHVIGRLKDPVPMFPSGPFGMDAIGTLLRSSALVITSRFHAAVIALGGLVPAIGITMDERIPNLFSENGLGQWVLKCDDPHLLPKLVKLSTDIQTADIAPTVTALLRRQMAGFASMGRAFSQLVFERRPDLAPKLEVLAPERYLPPLSQRLQNLL